MNRKQFICSAAGIGLTEMISTSSTADRAPKSPLTVTILTPSIRTNAIGSPILNTPTRCLSLSAISPHLIIAIQNTSMQDIKLWDEDSSWGFSNLTLEVSAIGHRRLPQPIKVERTRSIWFANFAQASTVAPGEMIMREVTLEPLVGKADNHKQVSWPYKGFSLYKGFPLAEINRNGAMTVPASDSVCMRAIFQVTADGLAEREQVWTGRVISPEHDYIITLTDPD